MASIDGVRRTRQSSKQPSESGDIQQPSIIVTRSIDDANNNASIRKRSTRSASRQASVEPQLVASQADEESRPAKRAKHKALPVLDSVAEHSVSNASVGELRDEPSFLRNNPALRKSVGPPSELSDQTHRTTFSQDEVQNLDADTILGGLPDLDTISERILSDLAPSNASISKLNGKVTGLLNETSYERLNFLGRLKSFNNLQIGFGQQRFIRPNHILRGLLGYSSNDEAPAAAVWRPDDIFYKINLVNFLQLLFSKTDLDSRGEVLETLDSQFPTFALARWINHKSFTSIAGESQLFAQTIQIAFEIRRQFFIIALHDCTDEESVNSMFADVFFDSAGNADIPTTLPSKPRSDSLRRFNDVLYPPGRNDMINFAIEKIVNMQRTIVNHKDDLPRLIEKLSENHSWTEFCVAAVKWVQMRHAELQGLIVANGGTQMIVHNLEKEVRDVMLGEEPTSEVSIKQINNFHTDVLKERRKRLSSRSALNNITQTPQVEESNQPSRSRSSRGAELFVPNHVVDDVYRDDNDYYHDIEQELDDENADQDLLQVADIRSTYEGRTADKENRRFIDQQAGAHRIRFDDSQDVLLPTVRRSPGRRSDPLPSSSSNFRLPRSSAPVITRTNVDEEEDQVDDAEFEPTQDGAFEVDTRRVTNARRARVAVVSSNQSPSSTNILPRTSQHTNILSANQTSPAGSRRPRQNPGQAIESVQFPLDPDLTLTASQNYRRANNLAKRITASTQQYRQPQSRNRFTQEEEEAVLDLIAEHGPSYAHVKKVDENDRNILSTRTGEDIRFKARNMKVDFLKSGVELPPGFDQVVLSKKEIENVLKVGVQYEQESYRSTSRQ